MAHLRVQVPSRDAPIATRCIAKQGLLHLVDLAHGRVPGLGAPTGSEDLLAAFRDLERRISRAAERVGLRLRERAGAAFEAEIADYATERDHLATRLDPIDKAVEEAWRGLREARDRGARANEAAARIKLLVEAGVEPARLAALGFTEVVLATAAEAEMERLAVAVAPAPCAVVPLARDGDRWLLAACAPASSRERLEAALRAVPCQRVNLPVGAAAWDPAALEREVVESAAAVTRFGAALARLGAEHSALLDELNARAEAAVVLLSAQTLFATAGRFTVISGWIPAAEADHLAALLAAATSGHAIVDIERPEEMSEVASGHLKVPILFRNPMLLRPFQRLLRIYDTPSYREVEPTAFFALSFLVMFGLMFGDVGHGAVLFVAGFLTFRYVPRFLDYAVLLMEAGVASAVFGVLFGSVFGVEHWLPALWLRPLDNLSTFMAAAVGLGVVLVSAGLVLNVVNSWRAGERVGALWGTRGLVGAFLYWTTLALLARAFLPSPWTVPGWAIVSLAGAAAALVAARPIVTRVLRHRGKLGRVVEGEAHAGPIWMRALVGSIEVVDTIFSFFTNTLSFVRVAAFAAVHAGILVALFALTDTLARVRVGGGALQVLSLVFGNVLVILLEGLTVTVQVLRLEYYEFFTRFFRGGGEDFRPLMLRPGGTPPTGTPAPEAGKEGPHVAQSEDQAGRADRGAAAAGGDLRAPVG